MNDLTLDQWVRKLTHFDNGGDALSLYALSKMYGVHTTVLTKGRARTTVHGNYPGILEDVLQLSDVKLVYLDQNRFATLWKKISDSDPSLRERSYNYTPMLPLVPPPTNAELETAETLLNMRQGPQTVDKSSDLPHPPEFISPNVSTSADAMDKITDRYDVNPNGRPLNRDAMDQIIGLDDLVITNVRSLHVETTPHASENEHTEGLGVETNQEAPDNEQSDDLCVKTGPPPVTLKECSVRLVSLESIIFPQTSNKPVPVQTPADTDSTPEVQVTPPAAIGDDAPTDPPSNQPVTSHDDTTGDRVVQKPKSKSKPAKKYGCRMCPARVDSAQELKDHHSNTHGIMYCKQCTKAFNNQLSLTRHEYEHKS